MTTLTGVVLLAKFVLAAFVGVRLWRLPVSEHLTPERLLGTYFLAGELAGGLFVTVAYGVWSSLGQPGSPTWLTVIHGLGMVFMMAGWSTILLFTQRTFHAASRLAAWVAWSLLGVLGATVLGRLLWEGFAISVSQGAFYWTAFGVRVVALAWAGTSTIVYWRRMRRRLRIGLADPLLTNRLLLWSVFAYGNLVIAAGEPLARVIYSLVSGDAVTSSEAIQGVAGPIIQVTLIVTSVFGTVTTLAVFLTFFPTERYRRWVERRAGRPAA